MNPETRRAHELLAQGDKMLARRTPRFDVSDWASRRPDDPSEWKAWLAELPEEPAPETDFDRWQREQAEQARRQEAEAAARRAKAKPEPLARTAYLTREMKVPARSHGKRP